MLAALVGLMMGVGLSFFLEYLDNTIKLPDEIDQYLNIPFLGAIPAYVSKIGNKNIDVVALNEPKSIISESLKGVRTALLFSSAEQAPTTILITSAGAKEGKTFCAANLAITMAQSGSKVVILDCDMRRPRLHRIFNAKREVGMSNFLVGTGALKDALIPTPVENLDFIPVGPIPPNPSEILGSNKMTALIEALKKKYDRIIIDSPPTSAVTDASILSSKADGVVLVIRAGDTPRNLVQTGLSRLNSVNAHILGAVLNGVKAERDGYYYYQYYYYSYYGDEEPKRRKKKHS
jgi:capsular exopolysaccharide synthesis family protein